MDRFDLTANLMSLGGLAIAIGMMVDASVVLVENIHRHLSDPRHQGLPRQALILNAAREVARPVVFGIIIIIIVFMPILSFQGMEGKMFKPMAYTIMIALMVSLILSITLSPVLCLLTFAGRARRHRSLGASMGQARLSSCAALGVRTSERGADRHRTHAGRKYCALSIFGVGVCSHSE